MGSSADYFARVYPILGKGLVEHTVKFEQLNLTGRVLELLAGCCLKNIVVAAEQAGAQWPLTQLCLPVSDPRYNAQQLLQQYLHWKNPHLPLNWRTRGKAQVEVWAKGIATSGVPRVTWTGPRPNVCLELPRGDFWAYLGLSYTVALTIRDCLLRRKPWPMGSICYENPRWPFAQIPDGASAVAKNSSEPVLPSERSLHILVVGCGSVGSEVVHLLDQPNISWTLLDAGEVSPFNPHRQWYGGREVGSQKVLALQKRLPAGRVYTECWTAEFCSRNRFGELLQKRRPDMALLATGTADHGPLAEVLWQQKIPHVVACAYPQARFFEVTTVLPSERTPCLHCYRGNLFSGVASQPKIPDEISAFLYQQIDDDQRERLYQDLVAEPATPIETGRVAEIAARVLCQALRAPASRSPWFLRMLQQNTTCLLGGNTAIQDAEGNWAYGIRWPGQVVRLGLSDIVGWQKQMRCQLCGRRIEVAGQQNVERVEDSVVNEALLNL